MTTSTFSSPWLYASNTKTILLPVSSFCARFKSDSAGYQLENVPVAKADKKTPFSGSSPASPLFFGDSGIKIALMTVRRFSPAIISRQYPSKFPKPCRSALGTTRTSVSPRLQSLGKVSAWKLGLDKPKKGMSSVVCGQDSSKILKGKYFSRLPESAELVCSLSVVSENSCLVFADRWLLFAVFPFFPAVVSISVLVFGVVTFLFIFFGKWLRSLLPFRFLTGGKLWESALSFGVVLVRTCLAGLG